MGNSDSHATFIDGVRRVLEDEVSEDDEPFWSEFFAASMSLEDIFEIISPDHVRHLREKRPRNLQALLRATVVAMQSICDAADESGVLTVAHTTVANTTVRLLTRIAPLLVEDREEGVVRDILWRPGGFCEESGSGVEAGAASPGQAPSAAPAAAAPAAEEATPLVDPRMRERPTEAARRIAAERAAREAIQDPPVLGKSLLHCIGRFLFLPGYTVTPRTKMTGKDRGAIMTGGVDYRTVWKGGIGISSQILEMPAQVFLRTRCEVLRCVLSCLCGPLFQTTHEYQEQPPNMLVQFCGGQVPHTANLFCSLMAAVFAYDPVGWGVPYASYFKGEFEEELVNLALQVLCVVMDFDPCEEADVEEADAPEVPAIESSAAGMGHEAEQPEVKEYIVDNSALKAKTHGLGYRISRTLEDLDQARTAVWGSTVRGEEEDGWLKMVDGFFLPMSIQGKPVLKPKVSKSRRKLRNKYRLMLQAIEQDIEIDCIFTGLVRMLNTVHQATHTILPNSQRAVGFYQEALVLLWHLLTLNKTFLKRVANHLDTNQLLMPVLYLLQQAYGQPHLVGLLHTASFVLLVLSSERSFGVRLNEPYSGKVPLSLPAFQGCFADVVALTLHKVISDGLPKTGNDALVEMLLTVLCNISPYVKCFALESCLKLISLIERCTKPSYIFRTAFTHTGLVFLVEMINNIIQYQFEGNSMLVYSVLRQREAFERLAELQLPEPGTRRRGHVSSATSIRSDSQPNPAEDEVEQSPETEAKEWEPDEAWLAMVQKKLPLQAITCLIQYLCPKVEGLCKEGDVSDQDAVLKYLRTTTMVGILPVPHPIVIRTYQASSYTSMWFTSYMWGVIFTRSQRMPLYDWKKIRLVVINQ